MQLDVPPGVTSALSLAAFAIAAAVRAYSTFLHTRERAIRSVPETERSELVNKTLEFFSVNTDEMTKQHKFDLAIEQVRQRAARSRRNSFIAFGIAVLGAIIVLAQILKPSDNRAEKTEDDLDAVKVRLARNERFQEQAVAVDGDGEKRELSDQEKDEAKFSRERGTPIQKFIAGIALDHCQDLDREYKTLERQSPGERYRILMLRGDAWYRCGQFEKAAAIFEEALRLRPNDFEARNSAARAHFSVHDKHIDANKKQAMELFEQNLAAAEPKSFQWARASNNIAVAHLAGGDVKSLELAEKAYQDAVTVYTRSVETAVRWAHLRNVAAAISLEKGGLRNLMQAKSDCEEGLAIVHQDTDPFEWARLQSNLGAVSILIYYAGSEVKFIELARQATDRALTVLTREAYPFDRGRTLLNKSEIDIVDAPRNALVSCKEALEIYTLEAYPVEWAVTQVQAARCLSAIGGDGNIEEAIQLCAAAEKKLHGPTRRAHLARSKIVAGNLWRLKLDFTQASVCYDEAASICTREVSPRVWALARLEYARCESIASAAASVTTVSGGPCERLRLAIGSVNDALTVFTEVDYPTNHQAGEKLRIAFALLDLLHGCGLSESVRISEKE